MSNLLSNAIKFTPVAGRSSRASLVPTRWRPRSRTPARDRPDIIPNLFRRYERGPQLTKDVIGTGLGLLIVRQIVEAHGGTVTVESEVGQGSPFRFSLRRVERCEPAAPAHRPA